MRLLQLRDNGDISLAEHIGEPPSYAILSHTWGADDEEVTFKDLSDGKGKQKPGYRKLIFCGEQAARHGLEYYWVDTCCIDKTSSSELSEAINSMFRWYHNAARCYVYLADVSTATGHDLARWASDFRKSRWFTRGWTLQELIAPTSVEFFSCEGQLLGDKQSLANALQEATGIVDTALQGRSLDLFSVEERLSWAAKRTTKREEDAAYSLFGLFDVHMALIYGEGRGKAFKRLRREIDECSISVATHKLQSGHQREARLEQIEQWFSAADPSSNYEQALKKRQEATGLWLLSSEQYLKWKTDPASFLWLYGIPGSGKTILSSTVIQDVLLGHTDDPETAIIYFYFDFNDSQKQNVDAMLRSLLFQLSQKLGEIPPGLNKIYSLHERGRQLTLDALLTVAQQMIQAFTDVYIVLDALDECSQRTELMQMLTTLGHEDLHNIHIAVTSRQERDIERNLEDVSVHVNSICLERGVVDEDIRQYVRQRLSQDKALCKWRKDSSLQDEIETALVEGSHGMFRWAVCQLDTLGKCRNRAALRNSLATLPLNIERTYDRILQSIAEEDSIYATRVLQWLTFAERPLSLDEIAEVVAVGIDRDPTFDEEEVLQDPMESVDICSSLVTVIDGGDETGSTTRITMLAHYSVKEYFLSDRLRAGRLARYGMHHKTCHSVLARACLGYLQQALQTTLKFREALEQLKLLRYCAEYWMDHAKEADDEDAETAEIAARFLSVDNSAYLNWLDLLNWLQIYCPGRSWMVLNVATVMDNPALPLHYAALFGLAEVVRLLLKHGADVNAHGGRYGNALQAAAGSGHQRTVNILLDYGAHVNTWSPRFGSALQAASEMGHEQVVRLLINAGADVNVDGGLYGCALSLAIGNDHTTIVELLLEHGADVEITLHDGGTPLTFASYKGHLENVKVLLRHGATVSATNKEGCTSVSLAAANDHLPTLEYLIEHGADIAFPSDGGWTPINSASYHGHIEVVKKLLSAGSDISVPNDNGWTPLITASRGDHYEVVKLLLEHDTKNNLINARSIDRHSALSWAATKCSLDLVKLLLSKGASTIQEDIFGFNTIASAAGRGRNVTLALLILVPEVGSNYRDRWGRTALWWAGTFGRADTVKFLLHELHADPSIADKCGRTPLRMATKRGHREVTNILQDHCGVVVSKEEIRAGVVRQSKKSSNLFCDICHTNILATDLEYHCFVCADGDWDICAECQEHGMGCMDDAHVLIKCKMESNAWVVVV